MLRPIEYGSTITYQISNLALISEGEGTGANKIENLVNITVFWSIWSIIYTYMPLLMATDAF